MNMYKQHIIEQKVETDGYVRPSSIISQGDVSFRIDFYIFILMESTLT